MDSDMHRYDPEPPPERPPSPAFLLLNGGASQASGTRQPGVPVYHRWVVDGKLETHEAEPPYSWPEPLRTRSTDKIILDLDTDVMPQTVEVRVYDEVGPDGVPDLETAELLTCEVGRLDGGDSCAMVRSRNRVDGSWQLTLPIRSWSGERFVAVWAAWLVPADPDVEGFGRTPEYLAAWLFSLEVVR